MSLKAKRAYLLWEERKVLNCPSCNYINNDQSKFCNNCGANFQLAPHHDNALKSNPNTPVVLEKKRGGCLRSILILGSLLLGIMFFIGMLADEESNDSNTSKTVSKEPEKEPFNLEKFKKEATTYPYKELARNPKNYVNKKVVFYGEVIQVLESGTNAEYRVNVTSTEYGYEDTIYVTYKLDKDQPRVLEEDFVTIWGVSKGLITYETVLGSSVTIPQVEAYAIEFNY